MVTERLGVDPVDGGEVVDIDHEHSAFCNVLDGRAVVGEHALEVHEGLPSLGLDTLNERSVLEAKLARHKEEIPGAM
jgi:hypothetical protein